MPITRHFLDWKQPALLSAVQYLCEQHEKDGLVDLSDVVLVFPGRRAGRRLMELLLERVGEAELSFLPPQIETGGTLPELLYESDRPRAKGLSSRLAWMRALKETPSKVLERVVPVPPAEDANRQWERLARTLHRLHEELAGEGLRFGDVAIRGPDVAGFGEQKAMASAGIDSEFVPVDYRRPGAGRCANGSP